MMKTRNTAPSINAPTIAGIFEFARAWLAPIKLMSTKNSGFYVIPMRKKIDPMIFPFQVVREIGHSLLH